MENYELVLRLKELLESKGNKKKLFKLNDILIYIIQVERENDNEKEVLYEFFKEIGILVKDNKDENFKTTSLVDIRLDGSGIYVNYFLWRMLMSNEGLRRPNSHSYEEFKNILINDKELYKIFTIIELKNNSDRLKNK